MAVNSLKEGEPDSRREIVINSPRDQRWNEYKKTWKSSREIEEQNLKKVEPDSSLRSALKRVVNGSMPSR